MTPKALSREEKYYCEYCGEMITPHLEYASEFFEADSVKYEESTGERRLVKVIKCPQRKWFKTKHTYRFLKEVTNENK